MRLNGSVIEALPGGMFKVKLENDQILLAHLSGKMRLNRLKILPGDTVTMEVSPYDLLRVESFTGSEFCILSYLNHVLP